MISATHIACGCRATGPLVFLLLLLLLASCAAGPPRRVPTAPGALAIDRAGNVYVGGQSLASWDASGNPRPFDAADVHAPSAIAADEEYLYCADARGIRRFRLADGSSVPFTGPAPAIAIEPSAVRAMDVAGSTLYVADARADAVRMFDTEAGRPTGDFAAPLPTAIAIDPIGQIWVAHDHGTIRAFRGDGYAGITYAGPDDVTCLAFGPGAKLYVADAGAGRVVTPAGADAPANFAVVLNPAAAPGRSLTLRAVAADDQGNLVTLQREPGGDRFRIAKWTPDKRLLWERAVGAVNASASPP